MKKIKIKNLNKKMGLVNKIFILCLVFVGGIFVFNSSQNSFLASVANKGKGLISNRQLIAHMDEIQTDKASRPMKKVTHWGNVNNYQKTKFTNRSELDSSHKTSFPLEFSDILQKYKYVSPYNVWESISNPFERKKVVFLKRLITTTWTASYDCSKSSCDWWKKNTGSHAGIDFVTSMNTPVYASMDGVVIKKQLSDKGFGNHIVLATRFEDQVYASFYAHLNNIDENIQEGDIIRQGEKIGGVGNSGGSSAPHLHFQINKLGSVEQVKTVNLAKQLFEGWINNIDGVKRKTVNPVTFVEENVNRSSDAFENLKDTVQKDNENNQDIKDDKKHSSPQKQNIKIQDIEFSKIDNKLLVGDTIQATIQTTGSVGNISISTSNNTIKPSQYVVSPQKEKNKYTINIKAQNIGEGQIFFNDGKNKEKKFFKVYEENVPKAYGLGINGPDMIYNTTDSEFVVYPIDKYGKKLDMGLEGKMEVVLKDKSTGKEKTIKEVQGEKNQSTLSFSLKALDIKDYKLKLYYESESHSFVASKNLDTQIFLDYNQKDEYAQAIKELYQNDIIQGSNGRLMGQDKLTRSQIVTILVRNKYGNKKQKFEKQMKEYMEKEGKFLDDVNGQEWWAPYMFKAYQDGIIKGAGNKALGEKDVTKAELITIYGRYFDVEKSAQFSTWMDVDSQWYSTYAEAAKSYNLYPFQNFEYFKPQQKISRFKGFESLNRYRKFEMDKVAHSSPSEKDMDEKSSGKDNKTKTGSGDSLKKLVDDLIEDNKSE